MKQNTPSTPSPFGATENKSAESLVHEAKTADQPDDTEETDMATSAAPLTPPDEPIDLDDTTPDLEPAPAVDAAAEEEQVEVELIHHLNITGPSGVPVALAPGARPSFPSGLAKTLVNSKIARYPDPDEA